jgi:hypothetical protein
MKGEIANLSVTKMGCAMRCPLQFRFRYKDRIPEPTPINMFAGRIVHAILEDALTDVIAGKGLPAAPTMDDQYLKHWDREWAETESKPWFGGWDFGIDKDGTRLKEECRALLPLALYEVLPTIKPILVEHSFEMDVDGVPVKGVLDLMQEGNLLVDWKTGDKLPKSADAVDIQVAGYSEWKVRHFGLDTETEVTAFQKIFLIFGRRPRVEKKDYAVTSGHRAFFRQSAAEIWKAVQADCYIPNPNGWWCGEKWCSFWHGCRGAI